MFSFLKNKKIAEKNKGFTLIETFVAITILMIAMIGPMTLLSRAITDSNYTKRQITANYLAQEGIEYAILLGYHDRFFNATAPYPTTDDTYSLGLGPVEPFDPDSETISFGSIDNEFLAWDGGGYSGGLDDDNNIYRREVTIQRTTSPSNRVKIVSKVWWKRPYGLQPVVVELSTFFNPL